MSISLLFHSWEQEFIKLTKNIANHFNLGYCERYTRNCQNFFINQLGYDLNKTAHYTHIEELRLLVNVIKHGEGHSAKKLKELRPDYFKNEFGEGSLALTQNVFSSTKTLIVTEQDFKIYWNAIKEFWFHLPTKFSLSSKRDPL
ncbi:hypothetical protein [Bacillus inaquosorum]|uniref:hypothetical protein n=1 Tax=Bacillus inaquosorum TaxID=483913 RepID=UPI0022818A47|nr:hypothetical protein [Bacillus inaquosorum]MCY8860345.1 hypothetical protein [Bacillus inaquosorum]MCY8875852.1 hypothetical protein [Bacillus inaquosorum]